MKRSSIQEWTFVQKASTPRSHSRPLHPYILLDLVSLSADEEVAARVRGLFPPTTIPSYSSCSPPGLWAGDALAPALS